MFFFVSGAERQRGEHTYNQNISKHMLMKRNKKNSRLLNANACRAIIGKEFGDGY